MINLKNATWLGGNKKTNFVNQKLQKYETQEIIPNYNLEALILSIKVDMHLIRMEFNDIKKDFELLLKLLMRAKGNESI